MFWKRKFSNFYSITFIGIILFGLVLGCGGSSQTCTGELVVEGNTFRGTDPDIEQARKNTCSKYCIEGDPTFDGMYRVWLDSPEGKKKKNPGKWAAMAEDKTLFKYVEGCTENCLRKHREGKQNIEVKCQ